MKPRGLTLLIGGAVALVVTACGTVTDDAPRLGIQASVDAVIDFEEDLTAGDVVDTLTDNKGITVTGGSVAGEVTVEGDTTAYQGGDPKPDNLAMIFDATCAGGCTGNDPDLEQTDQANVLIVSEDGDPSDPDDATAAEFHFDFTGFGPGVVTVQDFVVMDVETIEAGPGASVVLRDTSGDEIATLPIPDTGDSGIETIDVNVDGVGYMDVYLQGSGAIDDVRLLVDAPAVEGCTPGFWRNHAGVGPGPQLDQWPDSYDPVASSFSDSFERIVEVIAREHGTRGGQPGQISDPLLIEAVQAQGGGINALARHAVAALLNAESDDVSYTYSANQVIDMVKDAIDNQTFEQTKNLLEDANEAGCPL